MHTTPRQADNVDSHAIKVLLLIQVEFLWLEDMYITGVLAEAARLSHQDISHHHYSMYDTNTAVELMRTESIYLVGHVPSTKHVYKLWETFDE